MSAAKDASSPVNHRIAVTMFPDFGASTKSEELLSLATLAPRIQTTSGPVKDHLPWLKLARFGTLKTDKNCLRHDKNVIAISGVEGDYDAGVTTVDEAVAMLQRANVAGMIYTSPSHNEDAPRWRVLCPLSKDYEPEHRAILMARLNGVFHGGLSGESFTLSQSYYFGSVNRNPSHRVEVIDGAYLDERMDLDARAVGKAKIEYKAPSGPPPPRTQHTDRFVEAVIRRAIERVRSAPDGQKHHVLRAQARVLGGYQHLGGYNSAEAIEWLVTALPSTARDLKAARNTAAWGMESGASQPLSIPELVQTEPSEPPPDMPSDSGYWQSVYNDAKDATEPIDEPDQAPEVDQEFPATAISLAEFNDIPPREKVYGHFLFRKFISAIGAPGGSGKTAYAFTVALAVVTGHDILGEGVHDPGPVWIYNLEDPRTELMRRVKAAVWGHDFGFSAIQDKLFLDSGRDRPLVIAQATRDGTVIAWPQVPALIAEIKARGIRLLIVDPFVRSHRVEENVNDQIDFVAALWAQIADASDCAILLVHHFKKGGVSGDAGAFRGASALIDASRGAVTLATMTSDEAAKMGVDEKERWRHVRVDNAKLNLAPPPDGAMWLTLSGVDLRNATKEREGDSVQTVHRWEPPSSFADMSVQTVIRILHRLHDGPGDGEQYYLTGGTSQRWAGHVVTAETGKTEAQAKAILGVWKKAGLVSYAKYDSPSARREVSGLNVNMSMVSEMGRQE